ncbi:hypothetical protein [Rhizohabitans arisaemae]|uniref:hypothetical protein n=1 Tax=Rhizohabitans arisaemae TaxID=2720610 RepID=UPI0024B10F61|nr:hypothetical protein [Rhizohabitans arisaemae]
MNALPAESQYGLLVEHGVETSFVVQWVSVGDADEVVRRLGLVEETVRGSGFQEARSSFSFSEERSRWVWVAPFASGWSIVVFLTGGLTPSVEALSRDGQRVIEVIYELGEMEYPFYARDGMRMETIFVEEEYDEFMEDVDFDDLLPPAERLEQYLRVIGRITGRFLDREFFVSEGVLGRLSGVDLEDSGCGGLG